MPPWGVPRGGLMKTFQRERDRKQETLGFSITLCTAQGKEQRTIVFYYAHPDSYPCTGSGPVQYV